MIVHMENFTMRAIENPRVALKYATPNAEREIATAGRVCWESWPRDDGSLENARDFIKRLKKVGHIDVFEEAEMSIWIECSRACSLQIVRHRTFHFLQSSQRYVKANDMQIMVPPTLSTNGERNLFVNACYNSYEVYHKLTDAGVRKEDARAVLPNATLTKLKAKANFTNWARFFSLRSDQSAQHEVRAVSNAALCLAYEIAPSVFEDQYQKYIVEGCMVADIVDKSEFNGIELEQV